MINDQYITNVFSKKNAFGCNPSISTCALSGVRAWCNAQYNTGNAHTQSNLIHMNNSLSNITGLHEGWTKVMQLEYGNESRFAVRTVSLPYFKQADTTKQPTAIQTETMQPMWCNPNINIACPILRVCIKVGRKSCSYKMGIDAGSRHLTALLLSRQLQPNNLPVCKLYQIVTMQPMWSNPNIHTSLSNAISLQKVGRQSCRWNAGNNGGSYHFTAILQAGRYNETTHRYSNCDNATHVV